jgi:16S rRNA (adenine1518-N6/adenine1519-N6)-dimethyltransferase
MFAERGISPRTRLGQNFLIDLNVHEVILVAAELDARDVVLEVGSGTGALTANMAGRGAAVVAIDVDPSMVELTARAVTGLPNVRVLEGDALASKNALNPAMLDDVRAALAASIGRRFKVVANLPYHVATPVITNLLVHPELCPELFVVTIQRELAERMCAMAASAAYGALSVVVGALADVAIVRSLPPTVFWPQPQVDSAVVKIRPDALRRTAIGNVAWFHAVVRRLFLHRRKYLRHVLAATWRERWSKSDVDAWLQTRGFNGQVRAESLTVGEFIVLAKALHDQFAELPGARIIDQSNSEPEVDTRE